MRIDDLFSITGKVAVVTGGSRGIAEIIACDGGRRARLTRRAHDHHEPVSEAFRRHLRT